jgi:hypothetical protein
MLRILRISRYSAPAFALRIMRISTSGCLAIRSIRAIRMLQKVKCQHRLPNFLFPQPPD